MGDYTETDAVLRSWADARGLHVYTGHKQNNVRSVTVYVWIGDRHDSTGHIWLDPLNELGLVGLHAAAGSFRFDDAVSPQHLSSALDDAADRLASHKQRVDGAQTSISPRM